MYSFEITLLIVHAAIVGFCLWHLTTRTRYSEARLNFVLPLILLCRALGFSTYWLLGPVLYLQILLKPEAAHGILSIAWGFVTGNAPNGVCRAVKSNPDR